MKAKLPAASRILIVHMIVIVEDTKYTVDTLVPSSLTKLPGEISEQKISKPNCNSVQ